MLSRLTGTLESLRDNAALVALPGGLAYEVLLPAYLAKRLEGQLVSTPSLPITLHTLQYLDSPNQGASFIPRLVGFASVRDRSFFETFTTVKGIGNRKALRAMAVEPAAIARLIVAKDAAGLQKLPEIGKRLGETIIAELSGKVDGFLSDAEIESLASAAAAVRAAPSTLSAGAQEAVAALIALGESPAEAQRKVERVAATHPNLATDRSADEILAAVFGR
jgi:Holliday junction DNA helicase RuvA